MNDKDYGIPVKLHTIYAIIIYWGSYVKPPSVDFKHKIANNGLKTTILIRRGLSII